MRILIAEDDPNIVTILSLTLEQLGGHQVTAVENGQLAIDALKSDAYDVVLLDGMMPVKDGFVTCKEIKQDLKLAIPVIFLTAKTDEKSIASYLALGAIGVIAKPFEPASVSEEIENLIQQYGEHAC